MQVTGLFHVAIKTNDLDATVKFYTDVLGMKLVHRPDFGFPGAWIAAGDDVPIVHIYAGGPALVEGKTPYGTGSLDHVSLTIKGWDECLERVKRLGYDWRAAIVPGTTLWQIFVHDPERRDDGADLRRQGRGPADAGDSRRSRVSGRQAVRFSQGESGSTGAVSWLNGGSSPPQPEERAKPASRRMGAAPDAPKRPQLRCAPAEPQ